MPIESNEVKKNTLKITSLEEVKSEENDKQDLIYQKRKNQLVKKGL